MVPTVQCLVFKSSLQSSHLGTEMAVNKHIGIYIGECRDSVLANMSSFKWKLIRNNLLKSY